MRSLLALLGAALLVACSPSHRAAAVLPASVAATPAASVPPAVPVAAAVAVNVAPITTARTRGPIVLIHGAGGFVKLGNIEYFNGVASHLRARGNEVLVPQVAAVHTIDHRARQLRDAILAAYPSPSVRVNIIGHSMGGLDARAAISRLGLASRVASLTTIGTPHRGTTVADATTLLTPAAVQTSIDGALNAVGLDWNQIPELTSSFLGNVFNPSTPDDPGVFYQSYAGRADPKKHTGAQLSPVMWASWALILPNQGDNDGMVPVTSAPWGLFKGVIPADHLGEIGWGSTGFDHLKLYDTIVADLALKGF